MTIRHCRSCVNAD